MKDFSKPWFKIDDRDSERTLDQQMQGLGYLKDFCRGKTILDVGCAEGLISMELVQHHGAKLANGVELVDDRVHAANKRCRDLGIAAQYYIGEAENFVPKDQYDIVLMLAILHKLKNPTAACAAYADHCRELMVIRLPASMGPVIIDPRSNNNPHDIHRVLTNRGFRLLDVTNGAYDEWCGYYGKT